MSTSPIENERARAILAEVTEDTLRVDLTDGRTILVPVIWYPRLDHATAAERRNWQLIGRGEGLHWPDLDEDISIEGLLEGRASGESQRSLKRWLAQREREAA